jgi:hypothetical protein
MNAALKLANIICKLVFIFHIFGCLWHKIGSSEEDTGWLEFYKFKDSSLTERYIISVYFAIINMSSSIFFLNKIYKLSLIFFH